MLNRYLTYLAASGSTKETIRLRRLQLSRIECRVGPLHTLTGDDLLDWLASPQWAPRTRRSQRSAIVTFYRWAMEEGLLDHDPIRRLPSVRVPRPAPRPTPREVLAAALETGLSQRDHLLVSLAVFAGLRRAEIATLPWDHVRTDHLHIVGKGRNVRDVPLVGDQLARTLELERARRRSGRSGTGWRFRIDPLSPYVIPGGNGWDHMSVDRVGRVLSRLLGDGWTGHTLRHRFATDSYAVERDMLAVQDLLGHASLITTRGYVATPQDAARNAVAGAWREEWAA